MSIHIRISHFSGFLHHFVLAKLATSRIRVNGNEPIWFSSPIFKRLHSSLSNISDNELREKYLQI